jgi:puromycin-sensitive aminopeptidase
VVPLRYDLELAPDLDDATFRGTVAIEVDVAEPTDTVVLNALDLTVDAAWVRVDGADHDAGIELDPGRERLTLALAEPLVPGTAELHLSFGGTLDDNLVGFYRSTFTTPDPDDPDGPGTEHTVAVTQFESTHARRAFPCFDEPDLKAVFGISVVVADGLLAVSNASEVSRTPAGDGTTRICFADTIPMSTYLVALVVGPLETSEVRQVDGREGPIPLRVVHPPGQGHLCGFALDVADAGIRFLEDYYDIPCPGDKVDLVAVPDFAFGAMENLGCITFREALLLVDERRATRPELRNIAEIVNHELAHLWFGDLVTMRWWNGIWLNEAFATFMEVTATDAYRPDWDCWTTFGLARAEAFDTDALSTTRPIEYEVVTPADAEGMFDVLTYEKGASVVRMLERYLGAERFRDGIRAYLARHALGNTDTSDLWDALEESTGEPVRRIMDAWILRGGHPVVDVVRTDRGVRLSQSRFRYGPAGATDGHDATDGHGAAATDHDGDQLWPVPLVLSAGTDHTERVLLEGPAEVDLGGHPGPVQVNTGGDGFFRSAPAPDLLTELAAAGRPPLERFVLLDDAWAALVAGRLEPGVLVDLLRVAVHGETDVSVWRRAARILQDLGRLAGPAGRERVAALTRELAAPALAEVELRLDAGRSTDPGAVGTTDGDPDGGADAERELRGVLVAVLGTVGRDPAVRERAGRVFTDDDAEPELAAAALEVVAATATDEQHHEIEARWRSAGTPQDELRYLRALADAPDPGAFDRLLDLALTEIRPQNAPYLLRRALTHQEHPARAWRFVAGHWDRMLERFPASAIPRMLEGVRTVTDPVLAGEITTFLADHPVPSGGLTVDQHLERMDVTVAAAARLRSSWPAGSVPTDNP